MRIFADADVAFVYSPVILEGPSGTYLIGWGDKSAARNVRGWAKGGKNLHMFFFPAIKVIWLRAIHYSPLTVLPGRWLALSGTAHCNICSHRIHLGQD